MVENISVFFPEAWEYPDHYVVTVNFRCNVCPRTKVFTLHIKELNEWKAFGCAQCESLSQEVITPLTIYK